MGIKEILAILTILGILTATATGQFTHHIDDAEKAVGDYNARLEEDLELYDKIMSEDR